MQWIEQTTYSFDTDEILDALVEHLKSTYNIETFNAEIRINEHAITLTVERKE